MFYKYESTLDNDLIFWSNATADLWHKGEIGESDLPDELLHALNELWTDSHLVCCYLVEFKGRYGIALESIYDRDFAESLGVTYSELLKRVEKKANYISKECPQFDTLFGKDTQSWSNGGVDERCVAYVDCEDLFRLPPDYTHADVIDFSRDHIKVLDHQGTYVSVPCTCLDIK